MIHVGQSNVAIRLDTETDLTGATAPKILYQRPDGTTGEWDATVEGTFIVRPASPSAPFDMAGLWRLQAKCTFGALTSIGKVATERIGPALS
jgi:hypothetical protein